MIRRLAYALLRSGGADDTLPVEGIVLEERPDEKATLTCPAGVPGVGGAGASLPGGTRT